MDSNGPNLFRQRPSAERFLGAFTHDPPPSDRPSSSSDELNEDDIFFSNDLYYHEDNTAVRDDRNTPPSSSSTLRHQKSFSVSESFGILAAIGDPTRPHSHFYQKPSISTASTASSLSSSSSSSSSSSRMIPSIPKPPQERIPASPSSLGRHPQSAPVNVPLLAKAARKRSNFYEDYDAEEELEGEMLPPHEIVARSSSESPMLACSVLEGVGRTLKGRDLRQLMWHPLLVELMWTIVLTKNRVDGSVGWVVANSLSSGGNFGRERGEMDVKCLGNFEVIYQNLGWLGEVSEAERRSWIVWEVGDSRLLVQSLPSSTFEAPARTRSAVGKRQSQLSE